MIIKNECGFVPKPYYIQRNFCLKDLYKLNIFDEEAYVHFMYSL